MRLREWRPDYAREQWWPEPGDLVAHGHAVWTCVEVRPIPEVDWNDDERARVQGIKPEHQWKYWPQVVSLRPVAGGKVVHLGYRGRHIPTKPWHVYPDEHYPVCGKCGEPTPCLEREATHNASREAERMARYEVEDVCPACQGVITNRQRSVRFTENLVVPLGPPVTFHRRGQCYGSAVEYEKRWVAADPDNRRVSLTCSGWITNHADETYECTADDCPGLKVRHDGYTACSDDACCTWRGNRDCHPWPHYARRARAGEVTS